jgi:membrane protease YdiL (CAAX protease family)
MSISSLFAKHNPFVKRQFRKITTFLVITCILTLFFQFLILLFNPGSAKDLYILGIVWSPGIAALITSRLYRQDLAEFGWRWGRLRYHCLSYIIPLLYTLAAYLVTWLGGLGTFFNTESMQEIAKNYGWENLPQSVIIILYLIFSSTLGLLKACLYALGEEIGWRGFLVPELAKTTTFLNTALISGLAWAIWHYPTIIFGGYNNGNIFYSLFSFTLAVVAISFPMAWLRLKSGSLWTGMIFHASDNLFLEDVFSNLTQDTGITNYFVGEFGLFISLACLIPAYIFWQRRHELPRQ